MKTAIVIPARYGSMRFPGKALAQIKGKSLIVRVAQRASLAANIDLIAVATDDERIFKTVKAAGFEAFMTPECKSGTDRIAFIARNFLKDFDIFINVQGDEPLISPTLIDRLAAELKNDKALNFITSAYPFSDPDQAKDPNNVKVVFDKNGSALLFSRALIPYNRNDSVSDIVYHKHIGIYGYRRDFLIKFAAQEPSRLEQTESLEQLRALENGQRIKVIMADEDSIGVDEPQDIEKVEALL